MPAGPDAIHLLAQNRVLAEGKKLTPQEEAKRRRHPLDMWDDVVQHAAEDRFPKGNDVLAFKYHGLFFVAPAQNAYMCRLRFPGGIVHCAPVPRHRRHRRGVRRRLCRCHHAGQPADPRDPGAPRRVDVLTALHELGIVTRGAGADNIRNVTASPTAGIDPQELIDTRPLARAMHHYILNHREMYGLPRKFNIAFDGGGTISALEDTNDIGFTAGAASARARPVPRGRLFPHAAGRHHRPQGLRPRHGRAAQARRVRAGGGRRRPRLHRERRPHRPQEGPAQVRAGPLGPRKVSSRRPRSSCRSS